MNLYETARRNMVDCQIKTNGVTDERIIGAFLETPREEFVPEDLASIVYTDEDIKLDSGENAFLMEPTVFAKMLQECNIDSSDIVLNIGDDTGYSTAILSQLVTTVVVVEQIPGHFDRARQLWSDMGLCNIAIVKGSAEAGGLDHAPYSLVFMNGSVSRMPESLIGQLTDGGRLCTILRDTPHKTGQVIIAERIGEDDRSIRKAFDASTPYLASFEPKEAFVF